MPSDSSTVLLVATVTTVAFMLLLWAVSLRTRDAGIVDFGWALCIGAMAVAYAVTGPGSDLQRLLAGGIGGVWGFRLATHLLVDRVLPPGEDGRYGYLRAHWGPRADWHFLWFFLAQALLAVVFSLPFFALSQHTGRGLDLLQVAGLAVAALAIVGEHVADRQLARFRADPDNRGRVCTVGLWRHSRHPNYFFEWLTWCGIALVAWPAPYGTLAVLGPVAMYVFVTRVTGVPYTEAQALRSRGEAYRRYQLETNEFFPGPRRRRA